MRDTKTLIEKCRKGHSLSQSSVFDIYKNKWMGVCVRYVKDVDEAKDVFQEAAIRIFSDIKNLKQIEAFDGWARKIMVNHSLNYLKRKKVYSLLLEEYGEANFEMDRSDQDAIRGMGSDEVIALINQLPEGYRVVLNLALVDGYKHPEIAKLLNIAESTSRSQLTKARKSLQKLLEDQKINENARIAG